MNALAKIDREKTEVSPEVIEAGAEIIWREFGDVVPYGSGTARDVALQVFLAMASASGGRTKYSPREREASALNGDATRKAT